MNTRDQVYALIAMRPKIRTVEIADIIDCDVEHVQPGLAQEIARGDIIVHQVTAPNGRPANGFEFSPAFMRTAAYREIAASASVDPLPAPALAIPPASERVVVPLAKPAAALDEQPPAIGPQVAPAPLAGSYPDRAIAFIKRCGGRADNEALRIAIGLGPGTSPSSYLHSAVTSSRLARAGRDWVLGPNADITARYAPGKTAPRAIPAPATPGLVTMAAPAAFRCGRWSDGMLELQRGGETIATLAPAEQDMVMALLAGGA